MKDAFYTLMALAIATCISILLGFDPIVVNNAETEPHQIADTSVSTESAVKETISETEPVETVETEPAYEYTAEELDLLARIINAEAGSSWIPDEVQLYVGSVVLNRVKSDRFPDTIKGVIYQKGQYSPTWNGAIKKNPSQRAIDNARYLLENGSTLPENVVFQANFRQGSGVYYKYYDDTLGTTTYFCYI